MSVKVAELSTKVAGMAAVFAAALFVPAGTAGWPAAWLFLALFFGFTVALSIWLFRFSPDLLAERLSGIGQPDQKSWDKWLLAATAVTFFAWLGLMGIDAVRFHWSRVPVALQAFGTLLVIASFYGFFATFRENAFLSPAVRVQKERAQRVISTGPYRVVRHPMYAAFVLFAFGTALMLASWYGVLGAALLVGMVARRAVLEERVLREELEGYGGYITRVKYRFIPRVW